MSSKPVNVAEELKTLCNLGLTLQQAKVYLTLAKIGQASVKDVSVAANMDRGECYRVCSQLTKKRLISKVLTSPLKYEAISFNAQIKDLLAKKKKEISSLEENIEKLLNKMKTKDKPVITDETDSIRFVHMNPAVVEDVNRVVSTSVRKSVDAIMDVQWFESIQDVFYKGDIRALQRGIEFRLLISDTKDVFEFNNFSKYKPFNLRITTQAIAAPVCILDKKTAWIYISEENNVLKSTSLVTNNEHMTKLAQCYFDNLWEKSESPKLKKVQN